MNNFFGSAYRWNLIVRCLALVMISTVTLVAACSGKSSHETASPAAATVTEQTKNPLPDARAAAAAGKMLYAVHCTMCHGDDGKGEGSAGGSIAVKPTNLATEDVAAAAAGKLYLIIRNGVKKEGKQTMPPAKKVTDEEIWQIVTYVQMLARK